MPIAGQKMHDPNMRLRVLLLVFGGVVAGAAILYWRSEYLVSQEYIDFPSSKHLTAHSNTSPKVPKGYEDLYK